MERRNIWKVTACGLAGALAVGCFPLGAKAAPEAGISSYAASVILSAEFPTAGISLAMSQCVTDTDQEQKEEQEQPAVKENDTPVVASEYENMAVAVVNDYVNVRADASKDAEVVGKLYKNNVGEVLGEKDGWYEIHSGNVKGYVSGEYVAVGDEDKLREVGRRVALVTTETLYVRAGASTDDSVIDMVSIGEDLTVIDESVDGWVKVTVDGGDGYVSADYVELSTEYTYAESKEEEAARLKKEEEERQAAAAAAAAKSQSNSSGGSSSSGSSSSGGSSSSSGSSSYTPPSGSTGADVASFACQFVGNPYVYGGSSLTNGTDCSGFVMSVYANFGVSLPHSSRSLRSCGYGVSTSSMQAGDIVCYSGHVAIYIGGGQIVHASNRRDGIKISNVNYRSILAVRRIF